MNGESYPLKHSREVAVSNAPDDPDEEWIAPAPLPTLGCLIRQQDISLNK